MSLSHITVSSSCDLSPPEAEPVGASEGPGPSFSLRAALPLFFNFFYTHLKVTRIANVPPLGFSFDDCVSCKPPSSHLDLKEEKKRGKTD